MSLSQASWKPAYDSLLNFINEEREIAHNIALSLYAQSKEDTFDYKESLSIYDLTNYQEACIEKALFKKENNSKLYKPNAFKKATNRLDSIDLIDFVINVDKILNTISFTSIDFGEKSLDSIIFSYPFLNQFLTMVESIEWPTRSGPIKAIRGCTMIHIQDDKFVEFYSAGNNPPKIAFETIVAQEPLFLKTNSLKKLKVRKTPLKEERHLQEVSQVDPELY